MKRSFVLRTEYMEQVELLTDAQAGILFRAILCYVRKEELPDMDDATRIVFSFFKMQINQDLKNSGSGEYHWNWKGGVTPENRAERNSTQYKDFRAAVLQRDHFTCQQCGCVGGKLNVHHIKPFSTYKDLRFDVSNGITLCEKCHREVHKNEK